MREVIINQGGGGLGDQLFIEPIFRHYYSQGYTVISPVDPSILWLKDYITYVHFKDKKKFNYDCEIVHPPRDEAGRIHIPMRFAHPLYRGYELHYGDDRKNWMGDKYLYLGLDADMWRRLSWTRNHEKEAALASRLNLPDKFNFINNHFGGSFEKIKVTPANDFPNVYMTKIEGFTMLDWGKVIQMADNIYTAETALVYMIEGLPCIAESFHLYPRFPFLDNVDYMKDLLKDKWTYHDSSDLQ